MSTASRRATRTASSRSPCPSRREPVPGRSRSAAAGRATSGRRRPKAGGTRGSPQSARCWAGSRTSVASSLMPLLRLEPIVRPLLNSLLYFPTRKLAAKPADLGLEAEELGIETDDDERLHGWWIRAAAPSRGHILFCHGNGGNVGDRVENARLLSDAGFDVLIFDYRGYGRSSGRPTEEGTALDARAAQSALVGRAGVEAARVLYLGESLGAAVALGLALEAPPRGLILQSAFTSVRDVAAEHYLFLPRFLLPDATSRTLVNADWRIRPRGGAS